MLGIFIWTMIILFIGIFTGYVIGSYLENQKHLKKSQQKGHTLMKIDIDCIDTSKPLYGFWKYDSAPFILGGNIKSITEDHRITVEGYTGYKFKPFFITTKEKGEEIQKRIDAASKTYQEKLNNILVELEQTIKDTFNTCFDDSEKENL